MPAGTAILAELLSSQLSRCPTGPLGASEPSSLRAIIASEMTNLSASPTPSTDAELQPSLSTPVA